MPDNFWLFLLIGFVAGIMSGLFGIGGGVIIVPALIVIAALEPVQAIGTSLAALLLPVGILAVFAYHRKKLLDLRASLLIAVGLITTTWFGAQITLSLPADTLKQIYGVFLLYMSWRFIEPRLTYRAYLQHKAAMRMANANPEATPAKSANPPTGADETLALIPTNPEVAWYFVLMVGLIAGIASGMFGIGGGVVIVPLLVGVLNYDQKLAVGTSLGALLLPVGLPGVIAYQHEGDLDLAAAAFVAFGLLLGALVGANVALKLPSKLVKQLYGLFLIFIALNFMLQSS